MTTSQLALYFWQLLTRPAVVTSEDKHESSRVRQKCHQSIEKALRCRPIKGTVVKGE
jgi:hypothetical protein